MNERILELAKQSGLIQYDTDSKMNDVEKFAQLIVQECVSVAHPKLKDVGEWAAGMRLVQKRIKEHFGVK
jgi:hypothetical protein